MQHQILILLCLIISLGKVANCQEGKALSPAQFESQILSIQDDSLQFEAFKKRVFEYRLIHQMTLDELFESEYFTASFLNSMSVDSVFFQTVWEQKELRPLILTQLARSQFNHYTRLTKLDTALSQLVFEYRYGVIKSITDLFLLDYLMAEMCKSYSDSSITENFLAEILSVGYHTLSTDLYGLLSKDNHSNEYFKKIMLPLQEITFFKLLEFYDSQGMSFNISVLHQQRMRFSAFLNSPEKKDRANRIFEKYNLPPIQY